MKLKMMRLAIAASAAMSIGAIFAQGQEAAAVPAAAKVDAEEAPAAVEKTEVVADGGVEAVQIAEEAAPKEPPPSKPKDAEAEVKAWVKDKGWKIGRWDAQKKRLIVVVGESFDCEDPAKMADVMVRRDMAAKRAVLQAKAQIVQFVKEEVSAENIVEMLGGNAPGISGEARESVERQAAEFKGDSLKQTSVVESMAAMPLFGATCVRQSESWNRGKYQIAVALAWSPALERSARAVLTGEKVVCKRKANGKSVEEWLSGVNPAFMSGPIQFVDADGRRWFMGVSAALVDEGQNSLVLRKNRRIADMSAKQMCLFSLWGDVKAREAAYQALQSKTLDGKSVEETAQWMESKISESITKLPVRGGAWLYQDEVEHPVVGGPIYVSIYAVEPGSAGVALEMEAVNFATRAEIERVKTIERGRAAANKALVDRAKNDARDFNRGVAAQNKAVKSELESRAKAKGRQIADKKERAIQKVRESNAGVFNSGADADDDF